MAKNYPALYENSGYSIALEQKVYIKEETVRGTMVLPEGADFLYHIGGSVNYSKPIEDSPHKSGRHMTNVIEGKATIPWSLTTFFNIDTTLVAAGVAEIDPAMRVLFKSMYGKEDVTGGSPVYTSETPPNTTFTIMEIGDVWAKQVPGCFTESHSPSFPGDGRAQSEWTGQGKTAYLVGCGKSITANIAHTVTLAVGEGRRFPVGAKVMIIKANNSKSADTPAGSARTVTSVAGDVVTIDGAILADADGSGVGTPVYLFYYEDEGAIAIDNPQVGVVGSLVVAGETYINCVRTFSLSCNNNHEIHSNCYGVDGLGGPLFSNGGKLSVEATMEIALSKDVVGFYNKLKAFAGEDITLILGDAAGRHLKVELPKVRFNVPEIPVPETGTIPLSFTGFANQTALDNADEVKYSFL
jgi:hypothetical protein